MYYMNDVQNFRNLGTPDELLEMVEEGDGSYPSNAEVAIMEYGEKAGEQTRIVLDFDDGYIEFGVEDNMLSHMHTNIPDNSSFNKLIVVRGDNVRKLWFSQANNCYILESGRKYGFDSHTKAMIALTVPEMELQDFCDSQQ